MNWPVIDYAVCWAAGPTASPVQSLWSSVTERTEGRVSTRRGKQYELDDVQPGELTVTLRNNDGALDPSNTSSPFNGYVLPYRLFRMRAQWPATANLLTADQATALYASQGAVTTSTLPQWVTAGVLSVSIAPLNSVSNAYAVAAGTVTAGQSLLDMTGFSVAAGYTYSAQALFSSAASASLQLQIEWFNAAGSSVSVTSGTTVTNTSGKVTVTGTAPSTAAGAKIHVAAEASPTATVNLYEFQWEKNTAPGSYVTPGTWYSMFTGYVERWPQTWTHGGTYGLSNLIVVDLFGWLANRGLNYATYLDVLALSPTCFYPLDEQSGATYFADLTTNYAQVPLRTLNGGGDSPGSNVTATGGYAPIGISDSVLGLGNTPAISSIAAAATFDASLALDRVGPPTTGTWTRMVAFRCVTLASGNDAILWNPVALGGSPLGNAGDQYSLILNNTPSSGNAGQLQFGIVKNNAAIGSGYVNCGAVLDGGWHLVVITMNAGATSCKVYLDGSLKATLTNATNMSPNMAGGSDQFGGFIKGNVTAWGFTGDLACFAEFPAELTATQVGNLYQGFRYGWGSQSPNHTETSGGRYQRLLNWAGLSNASTSIDTGMCVDYGPAVDVQGGTSPSATLAALQDVVTTESGQHYIAGDGTVVFAARSRRYNTTSTVTFGESVNTASPRTNLATNPSLESGTSPWSGGSSYWNNPSTISQSSAWAASGSYSLLVQCPGTHTLEGCNVRVTSGLAANTTITVSATINNTTGRPVALHLRDETNLINSAASATVSAGQTTRVSVSITTGASTPTSLLVACTTDSTIAATTFYIDALLVELSSSAGSYFDGSTATDSTYQYAWTGTPNASTSTATPIATEIQYIGAATDYDPTRIANDITVQAEYGQGAPGTSNRVVDTTSSNTYGTVTLQRTINTLDTAEMASAAQYLLYQNKQPLQRIDQLPVDVASATPAVWADLLALELGDTVTIHRRPNNAPTITVSAFLEQIQWTLADDGSAQWTGQLSSALLHQFAELDSSTFGKFDSTLIFGY